MSQPARSLDLRLWLSCARLMISEAVVLLGAAGDLAYAQAWLLLAVQLATVIPTNLYLIRKDRELLRRRLLLEEQGEKEPVQKLFFLLVMVLGVALLAVSGLDHRFAWSRVPTSVVGFGVALFAVGAYIIHRVFVENSYASSVIEVMEGQRVVATGPYRLVRHPMYTGVILSNAGVPLVLGSYWAELVVLLLLSLFMMRLLAEEKHLAVALPGYVDYMRSTPARLVPAVW